MKSLTDFRVSKQKTPAEMAELMGVSLSLYEKVEYGQRTPSYNFIKKFIIAFPDFDVGNFFAC